MVLVTESRPEDRVGKIDVEHPGNRGKRGKMELLVTENKLEERDRQTPTWNVWKGGSLCPEVSFFHAFHDFQGVQNRFWNRFLESVFGVQELHFSTLSTLSSSLFEPCSSSPVLVSRSSIFPRFPCCSEFTFEPCSSRFGFLGPPNTPWKPWKAWKWWKRLARVRGPMVFFVGLSWMQQREATTRRNDLSARLADSVSRPNGQLTRAG